MTPANSPYRQQGAPHGSVDPNCLERIRRATRVKAAILPQQRRYEASIDPDRARHHTRQRAHIRPSTTRASAVASSSTRVEYRTSSTRSSARSTMSYPAVGSTCLKAARRRLFTRLRATAPPVHLTTRPSLAGPTPRGFAAATATKSGLATRRPWAKTRRKSRPLRKEGGFLTRREARPTAWRGPWFAGS